jgi:16S rRNA (cytosine967-C5)-methyltransferase
LSRSTVRPDGARSAAARILLRVEREGAWASVLLDRFERRLGDPREAGLLHETVLGVLRHRAAIDHALGRVASRPVAGLDAEVRAALRIGSHALLLLDRIPAFAAVSSAVDLVRGPARRSFVNAVLREVARRGRELLPPPPARGDTVALATYHSFPLWWVERHAARSSWEETVALAEASNRPAPTTVHPASGAGNPERLARRIAELGLDTEPGRVFPDAIRIRAGSPARLVEEGLAWVQDEAARIVPRLLGRPYGRRVADLCAAPGGKSIEIARGLAAGGTVVAVERHASRSRRLASSVARFAPDRVLVVRADAGRPSPLRPVFDQVLLDAPCSGTGTLRRNPEIKWRLEPADLERFADLQLAMLEWASERLRPGGQLVYSTCSVEPEENEQAVGRFLDNHPVFKVQPPEAPAALRTPEGYLRTWPHRHGSDGFFAAVLTR